MSIEMFRQRLPKIADIFQKYKYALLVLLLGIVLMCLPGEKKTETAAMQEREPLWELEEDLRNTLAQIEGAGAVEVLLSRETGNTYVYQQDSKMRSASDATDTEETTVLVGQGSTEVPLQVKEIYPAYRGALIVCQGADRASVKLAVIRAVSALTGLSSEKITVVKMKTN